MEKLADYIVSMKQNPAPHFKIGAVIFGRKNKESILRDILDQGLDVIGLKDRATEDVLREVAVILRSGKSVVLDADQPLDPKLIERLQDLQDGLYSSSVGSEDALFTSNNLTGSQFVLLLIGEDRYPDSPVETLASSFCKII